MKKKTNGFLIALLAVVILLPYVGLFLGKRWVDSRLKQVADTVYVLSDSLLVQAYDTTFVIGDDQPLTPAEATFVVIDKQEMRLHVYDYKGKERMDCPVTTGFNYGNKRRVGDYRTPEGIFRIEEIMDASTWEHDFGDGLGSIKGAYGPLFFRLRTPGHKGIGIHGTHKPEMLGKRDSEGCIRLQNENLVKFRTLVRPGTVVIVLPGDGDVVADLLTDDRLDTVSRLVTRTAEDLAARKKAARPGKRNEDQ